MLIAIMGDEFSKHVAEQDVQSKQQKLLLLSVYIDLVEFYLKRCKKCLKKAKPLFVIVVTRVEDEGDEQITYDLKKKKQTGDKAFKTTIDDKHTSASLFLDENKDMSKRMKVGGSLDLSLDNDSLQNVTEVGTTTPVQDFEKLLQRGFNISTISIQMEKVILNLIKISYGSQMNEKLVSCLQCYREACIDLKSPTVYNKFIRDLKLKAGISIESK